MKLIINNRKDALDARKKINEFLKCYRRDNSAVINGVQYIDLGLPSGILWAEHNATTYIAPEYPFDPAEKTHFTFDEAVEAFGSALPVYEDFKELHTECTWSWDDDRKGCVVTGKNGNSIFLPAAGQREPKFSSNHGFGFYRSSSTYDTDTKKAHLLAFGPYFVDHNPLWVGNKSVGCSVRLVRRPQE